MEQSEELMMSEIERKLEVGGSLVILSIMLVGLVVASIYLCIGPDEIQAYFSNWRMIDVLENIIYTYIGVTTVLTIVIAKFNKQLAKFSFFNITLPFLDVGTDVKVFVVYLFYENHPYWAALTIFWVFVPFFMHLGKFFYQLCNCSCACNSTATCTNTCTYNCSCTCEAGKADWKDVFNHIPFIRPLRNAYLACRLYKMRFGFEDFDPKNWPKVETIQREVAESGLSESFFEAGPQSTQQLVICFSTGSIHSKSEDRDPNDPAKKIELSANLSKNAT